MKKIIILSIILIFQIPTLFAQVRQFTDANITGHVIDKSTGEHLPFVSVAIKETTLGKMTDATGHFLLKNVPVGEHTIVASYIGYDRAEQTVVAIADKTIEVFIELEPQALELSGVVVTGSRNETNRRESTTIVGVLSPRLFETTGATCVANVLNFQPGLRVENTCNNCGAPELRINGLSGQYTQILMNGHPVFSSLASVYGLEQLPIGMVERIEVIRGGGSALYGSSAIGGVVNIITKEPLRNSVTLSNTTGIFGKGKTDINNVLNGSFVSDDFKTGAYLFATTRNRDPYIRDEFSDVGKLRSETLGFRAYHNLTNNSRITADYHRINEFRRGGNEFDRPPHEADIAEQTVHQINGGGLKYDFFSKDYKHRFNIYTSMQGIQRESYYGTDQDPDAYGYTTDLTFVAGSQYTYSMDNLWFMPAQFTAGIELVDNDLDDKMPAYDRHLEQRSTTFGSYVQNEWKNERFSLSLGARLDYYNILMENV
ncbi:MAG: TonB-dependent receptor, partial [Bacteroidales bacterium]|nr:TonB-dependent receptor [Bacteroidales bacterium]